MHFVYTVGFGLDGFFHLFFVALKIPCYSAISTCKNVHRCGACFPPKSNQIVADLVRLNPSSSVRIAACVDSHLL